MNKIVKILAIIVALIFLSLIGYWLYWHTRYELVHFGGYVMKYDRWTED